LLGELRLAQRQGLLVGTGLSYVQFAATQILQWAEDIAAGERTVETIKLALIARNDPMMAQPWELLPERIAAPTNEDESVDADTVGSLDVETEEGKLGVDYSGVDFKGSEAIEEYEQLMRQIGSITTGSFSGAELQGDGGWM
jgi:hypothetical protein